MAKLKRQGGGVFVFLRCQPLVPHLFKRASACSLPLPSPSLSWPQDAAELRVQDIPKSHGGIIAVSQSGETRDTLKGEPWVGGWIGLFVCLYCSLYVVRIAASTIDAIVHDSQHRRRGTVCTYKNRFSTRIDFIFPLFPPYLPNPSSCDFSPLAVDATGCSKTALKAAEMVGIPRLSVVNVVGSAIARETKMGVYLNAGRETAVASTKAFTTQVRPD